MKRSLNVLIKGLIAVVLFTGSAITLSTAGVETVSEAKASVSQQQVTDYLVARGYEVLSAGLLKGSENWYCHTVLQGVNYGTTVYVSGSQITGNSDVPL